MAAQIVHQTSKTEGPVAFEYGRSRELLGGEARNQPDRLGASSSKNSKRFLCARGRVGALGGQRLRINRWKSWIRLAQDTMQAHMISVDFNIAHVAHLFDRCE